MCFCPLAHRVGGHFADQPIPTTPWEKTEGNVLPRGQTKSSILCPDSRPCTIVASRLAHKPTLFALPQAKDLLLSHASPLHPPPCTSLTTSKRSHAHVQWQAPLRANKILEQIRTAVRANSQISRRGSCALLIWPSVWPISVWPWPRLAADLSVPIAQIRHRHNHFGWRQRMRGACAG